MSIELAGFIFTVTRHAKLGACPKCLSLDGFQWITTSIEAVLLIQSLFDHPNGHCDLDVEIDVNLGALQIG